MIRHRSGRLCTPAVILGLLLLACALAAAETPRSRLEIEPAQIALAHAAETVQCVVTLYLPDGSRRDVTRSARYEVDNAGVAQVRAGQVGAAGDGACKLTVCLDDPSGNAPLTVSAPLVVKDFAAHRDINFRRDIVPVLSKYGCNSGGCHGKLIGQNGFRLSLFGFDPQADYNALAKESRGRRVFPAAPERSMLLTKPSGQAAHGGGKRLEPGSPPYRLLLRWIEQGLPWGEADLSTLVGIEITPRERVMQREEPQQLRVIAKYQDGSFKDVTADAEYRSQSADIISVDGDGLVSTLRVAGEGTVLVRYLGHVDVARVSVPFSQQVTDDAYAHFQPANFIDSAALKKWRKLGLIPSQVCDDLEFLRRAFLDTIGVLPEPAEIREFVADARPDKRAQLVERLLARPEFVDYWAVQWGDLLQNRKERDHDVRGAKNVRLLHDWIHDQVAANRPWDQLVRDVLTVSGSTVEHPAVGYFVVNMGEHKSGETSELVTSVAQAFLGTRLGCAKCHNHPLERYTQDDYYHFAAFFSRLKMDRKAPQQGATLLSVSAQDPRNNDKPIGVVQPRTGMFMAPQTLDRAPREVIPGNDPREKLADWILATENEYFAGAMVNRLCRHFLGVGLVEPVDDLRATNPPTNPELWQAMSKEFVDHNYDLRHLMRVILNSRTYQLSSATRSDNASDAQFYSHYYARRLPAEVLLDALSQVAGVPDTFPGYPVGVRAMQLPDPGLSSYFLSLFGRSNRTTACACERQGDVTLPQLLHLQNGESVVQKIKDERGRLARLLKEHTDLQPIIDELFLATFTRLPSDRERASITATLGSDPPNEVLADLLWALLNSKEFNFNH